MTDFNKNLEKNFRLFKNIQNKIDKKKKIFSLFNFFDNINSFFYEKNTFFLFGDFLALIVANISTILLIYLILFKGDFQLLFIIPFILIIFLFFIAINTFLINRLFASFFVPKLLKNNFSKKEIFFIKKFKTKNINNLNNIFIFTLENIEIKKEHFNDITSFFNQNKDLVNNKNNFFLVIKNNFVKQYKKSKISAEEFKYSINFFINSFNIKDKDLIKKTYLEIENLTFDEKDENENSNFNFQTNKKESIIF